MSRDNHHSFIHNIDRSTWITLIGIILLFSTAVISVLIAPSYIDPSWVSPTTPYQVQMYEVSDPNFYISSSSSLERQTLYHLKDGYTVLAFQEDEQLRILAPSELEKYVTRRGDETLKLTSKLLLLRTPSPEKKTIVQEMQNKLKEEWVQKNAGIASSMEQPNFEVWELYAPEGREAFAPAPTDSTIENWADRNFVLLDDPLKQPHHSDEGLIYIKNPHEYRISFYNVGKQREWRYDPKGEPIASFQELKSAPLGFVSRQELIQMGEHIFAIEGCWYCHTDQTRTLVQDVVANGSESYPAPPSSANEYIYQKITFPGTRRIGPDLSRVGIKRPSRDWHKAHFWSPKTASKGSIMPSFRHFFDNDPRGTAIPSKIVPNYQFEAIFQYLMTKGTRINPPTEAWWLGKDPIKTKEVIEGRVKLR